MKTNDETLDAISDSLDYAGHSAGVEAIRHLQRERQALVAALRDIAAMGNKAGSETAKHRLAQLGIALEDGGYIPGKGCRE